MPPVSIDMALRCSAAIGLLEWYWLFAPCKEWWAVPTLHLLLWQRVLLTTEGRDREVAPTGIELDKGENDQ